MIPCFCKASFAYCEHVGVNLHFGPINGDNTNWYTLMMKMSGSANILERLRIVFLHLFNQAL